jgi:hypothetical protein
MGGSGDAAGAMLPEGEDGNGARGAVVPGNSGTAGAVGGGGTAGFAIDVRGEFAGGAGLRMTGGMIS